MTTIENRDWRMMSAGLWVADMGDHHFAAANHPRCYPRGWRVTDNGTQVIFVHTLKAAQDWVRRNYCQHGWNVDYSGHHHFVTLSTDGSGPFTHFEALSEAHRLDKLAKPDEMTDMERRQWLVDAGVKVS